MAETFVVVGDDQAFVPGPELRADDRGDRPLLPDHLDQDALGATSVKLTVEYLFPRTEIKPAISDGDHNFTTHDLSF